ncbi:hypothetical protein CGSMWGv55152_02923 [Gardnerella vaginalis 55152]|uniref:Uncharacterized protein n=1 Tax=Gardnerella vaginalis 55152 TaxID=698955 RepID=I4LU66_GARVA|nr:hypothetical protein CGSMWGv55152_02923 [Gardnerella vaginalis 55152]
MLALDSDGVLESDLFDLLLAESVAVPVSTVIGGSLSLST